VISAQWSENPTDHWALITGH